MLLLLDDEHKSHLEALQNLDNTVVAEFVKISVEFLKNGINRSMLSSAASKLKLDLLVVENLVDGLMYLLAESSKLMISEIDFHDSMMTLGLSEDKRSELVQAYLAHRSEIRLWLEELSLHPVQYRDLEWRLNIKLASRAMQGQTTPNILMKLHTTKAGERETTLLECDIPNLINLTNTLDEALQEAKSQYTRRILRNIK